jgi:hypothetical protein
MYLMPNSNPVNNRKWNLGRLGCNCSPHGIGTPPQKRLRGLHRLGDGANACIYYGTDGMTVESVDQSSDPTECASSGGTWGQPPASTTTSVGLPAGSQLSYTATWKANPTSTGSKWNDPNGIQSAITSTLLNQYGIVIDSQTHTTSDIINISGGSGFTLQVHTLSDRNSQDDVKSVVDGLLYQAGLVGVASQIITLKKGISASPAGTPLPPGTPPPPQNALSWVSNNLPLVGLGLLALLVVKK